MRGQISIDYIAGALVFFGAIIFLVSSLNTVFPQYQQQQRVEHREMAARSVSTLLLHETGRWANGTHAGTDWHHHAADATILGLAATDGVSTAKIAALTAMPYDRLTSLLGLDADVNIQFSAVRPVDTHRSFPPGDPPSFLTPPALTTDDPVHYGHARLNGTDRYLLLADTGTYYDTLYLDDDWDFTDAQQYSLDEDQFIPINEVVYRVPAGHTATSEGRLVLFDRDLGTAGTVPPASETGITTVTRYAAADDRIVTMEVRLWR